MLKLYKYKKTAENTFENIQKKRKKTKKSARTYSQCTE